MINNFLFDYCSHQGMVYVTAAFIAWLRQEFSVLLLGLLKNKSGFVSLRRMSITLIGMGCLHLCGHHTGALGK